MVTETAYPFDRREDHPYRRFADANGFTVAIDEIRRILPLPVDPALLQTLAAEVAPHHTAYRIASFVDSLPDELIASYCALSNQLGVDAPTGDVDFEAESMTPVLWLANVAKEKGMGRTRLTTVKVRNLQQLAAAGSGRVRVLTCNAQTNHHMVDINVRLGFEAVEVTPMFELRIDSSVGPRTEQRAQVSASTT